VSECLHSICKHALQNVPFYQKRCESDALAAELARLPVLGKDEVVQAPGDFFAADYLLFPKKEHMVIKRSVGASGKTLKVHWDAREAEDARAEVRRLRQEWYGVAADDPYCYFFTMEYQQNSLVYEAHDTVRDDAGRHLGFAKSNLTEARLWDIHGQMVAFNPVWLVLTPNIAKLFAEAIRKNRLPALPQLRYVELTSEMSDDATRAALAEVFACPVGNRYAAAETGDIALACPEGHLHILRENVFVEVFRGAAPAPDGVEGKLVLTSRWNYAMPMLRYQIGDRGYVAKEACPCGHPAPVLCLTAARANDFISLPCGGRVVADIFLYAVETINERIGPVIRQFRVTQTSVTPLEFTVRRVLHPPYSGWTETIRALFVENLREDALRGAAVSFDFGESLLPDAPRQPLGYFRNGLVAK